MNTCILYVSDKAGHLTIFLACNNSHPAQLMRPGIGQYTFCTVHKKRACLFKEDVVYCIVDTTFEFYMLFCCKDMAVVIVCTSTRAVPQVQLL